MNRRAVHALSVAATLLLHAMTAAAQPSPIACPPQIQPGAIKVATEHGGVARIEFPLNLYSAGMSSGPPGSLLTLRGEELRRDKRTIATRYGFDPAVRPNDVWLDCAYGEGGEIGVSYRLDARIGECVVTKYAPVPGKPRRIDVQCK